MKKLIIILSVLAVFVMIVTIQPVTTGQYWWKTRQYFSDAPILNNSGGTNIDTLATQAYQGLTDVKFGCIFTIMST